MLGMSLMGRTGRKVGVLVLWNPKDSDRPVRESDLKEIEPLADLAAEYIETLNFQLDQSRAHERLLDALRVVQGEPDRDLGLRHVLRCNCLAPDYDGPLSFVRVRLFLFDRGANQFRGYMCEGMGKKEGAFKGVGISIADRGVEEVMKIAGAGGAITLEIDPAKPAGFDPIRLGWLAEGPGRRAPEMDRRPAHDRRPGPGHDRGGQRGRPEVDPPREPEHPRGDGGDRGRRDRRHETTEQLAGAPLFRLHEECAKVADPNRLYALVLMHLTCGLGLKFHRAFYMEYRPSESVLAFRRATGSLATHAHAREHMLIAKDVSRWDYDDFLKRAPENEDRTLNGRLEGFTIGIDEMAPLLEGLQTLDAAQSQTSPGPREHPGETARLIGASCVLANPVRTSGHLFGVLFVDSPFEGEKIKGAQAFSRAEERAFRSFVDVHVARIFATNYLLTDDWQRSLRGEQAKRIKSTSHDLRAIKARIERHRRLDGSVGEGIRDPAFAGDIVRKISEVDQSLLDIERRLLATSPGPSQASREGRPPEDERSRPTDSHPGEGGIAMQGADPARREATSSWSTTSPISSRTSGRSSRPTDGESRRPSAVRTRSGRSRPHSPTTHSRSSSPTCTWRATRGMA